MVGRNQKAEWFAKWRMDGKPMDWEQQFVPAGPYSHKVRCRQCGSIGYPGVFAPHPWQISCLIGHKDVCEDCGAKTNHLYQHQNCMYHSRCCKHSDTQYRQLQKVLEQEESRGGSSPG